MAYFIKTEFGDILSKSIIKLTAYIPSGNMYVGLTTNGLKNDLTWQLFFEQGGDYVGFDDAERSNASWIEDHWLPNAIETAINEMSYHFYDDKAFDADMQYFRRWAGDAREALLARDQEQFIKTGKLKCSD